MGLFPAITHCNADGMDDAKPVRVYSRKMIRLKLAHDNHRLRRPAVMTCLAPLTCATSPPPLPQAAPTEVFSPPSCDPPPHHKLFPVADELQIVNSGVDGRRGWGEVGHTGGEPWGSDSNCNGNHVVRSEGLSVSPHGVLPLATNNNQFKPIGARSEALSCQPAGYNHLHHSRQQTNNHNTCGCRSDDLLTLASSPPVAMSRGTSRCLYVSGLPSPLSYNAPNSMRKMSRPTVSNGNCVKQAAKDAEPKYADPLLGAPHDFQQRIAELASLEADTIRNERYRKARKKTRSDKDS